MLKLTDFLSNGIEKENSLGIVGGAPDCSRTDYKSYFTQTTNFNTATSWEADHSTDSKTDHCEGSPVDAGGSTGG